MEKREGEKLFFIWVNWDRRVISFTPVEGIEARRFATHEEMIRFAVKKGNEGFGIQ